MNNFISIEQGFKITLTAMGVEAYRFNPSEIKLKIDSLFYGFNS